MRTWIKSLAAALPVAIMAFAVPATALAQSQACQIEVRETPVGTSVFARSFLPIDGRYFFMLRENVPGSEALINTSGPFRRNAPSEALMVQSFLRHNSMIRPNFLTDRNPPARPHGHLISYVGELRVFDSGGRTVCETRNIDIRNGRGEPMTAPAPTSAPRPGSPSRAPTRPRFRF